MPLLLLKLFAPIGAYFVRMRHRMAVDEAKSRVENSDRSAEIWREHIRGYVFTDVTGEGVAPHTVEGSGLRIHLCGSFGAKDVDCSADSIESALCCDHRGAWYKLYGVPGIAFGLERISVTKAVSVIYSYQELVTLAKASEHVANVDRSRIRSCNDKIFMRIED